jgi:hypothetical protein
MKNFKSIAERNAEFANMTKMEKRVALAKDVFSQLEMKKFIATPGTYINSFGGYENGDYTKPIVLETCNVCALGALTVSLVDGDAFNSDGHSRVSCHDTLAETGLWTSSELEDIECAFENAYLTDDQGYWDRSPPAEDRLKEIMLNIVMNNGEFKGKELPFKY